MRILATVRARRLMAAIIITYLGTLPGLVRSASAHESGPRIQQLRGEVTSLAVFGGDLVAGGSFTSDPTGSVTYRIARWAGNGWQPYAEQPDGPVKALAVMRDQLIVGGEFENVGSMPANHLAAWDGTHWSTLRDGANGPIYALHVRSDYILYVGGAFTEVDGIRMHGVAQWSAGQWSVVGGGLDGQVNALADFQGSLIAGGDFHMSKTDPYEINLARLVNDEWRSIARGIDGSISTLLVWNRALVAGGDFLRIDFVTPAHRLAVLRSSTWSTLGFGFGDLAGLDGTAVRTLAIHKGVLIAAGSFTLADLKTASFVAQFDGTNWWAVGAGTNGSVETLVSQGDVLYAGGSFDEAGGNSVGAVAGYRGVDWMPLEAVPVVVENLAARATATGVELEWRLGAGWLESISGVDVERSVGVSGPYERATAVPLAPARHMSFHDPGSPTRSSARFYRLALRTLDGRALTVGPVEVEQVVLRNRLRRLHESPSDGTVAVTFELAKPGPVQVSLYDVRGRRLAGWTAPGLRAGTHEQYWDRRDTGGARVHRGVVLVRLEAGGTRDTRKLVLHHN